MAVPETLYFTDLEVSTTTIFNKHQNSGPMNRKWIRTVFMVPDQYEAPKSILDWLRQNCPGQYQYYVYANPKRRDTDYIMVLRFEDKNDALFFKLRGGHQVWQSSQQ